MPQNILKTVLMLLLTVLPVIPATLSAAPSMDDIDAVKRGEIYPRDKFVFARIFENEGIIRGDLFYWVNHITSTGTVTGDIIGAGEYISLSGNIQGDIIGMGVYVRSQADVRGNIRVAGENVTLGGSVGKNVIACGSAVDLKSVIGGSLIACGRDIVINGKIKKDSRIYGKNIILAGEFFGDVTINDIEIDKDEGDCHDIKVHLTVLPRTVIHGKLKFKGDNAEIKKGASIADFQWIKSTRPDQEEPSREVKEQVWNFVRMLFATVVFFLIGLSLYKTFPLIVTRTGDFAIQKPLNAALYGLMAVFSMIPVMIIFVVLMALSIIATPAFGLIFGLVAICLYFILFYFSILPVGLWIGNLLLKEKLNLISRLGLGLLLFNSLLFALKLCADLNLVEPVFRTLGFIIKFAAVLLGSGALLYAVREYNLAAKRG